jgi:hypothetical protein
LRGSDKELITTVGQPVDAEKCSTAVKLSDGFGLLGRGEAIVKGKGEEHRLSLNIRVYKRFERRQVGIAVTLWCAEADDLLGYFIIVGVHGRMEL